MRDVAERRNWGYWDGRAARKWNRLPEWAKPWLYRGKHPFDRAYGEAFWAGWYSEAHPNAKLRHFDPRDVIAADARDGLEG